MTLIKVIEKAVNLDTPKASKKTKRFIEFSCNVCGVIKTVKYSRNSLKRVDDVLTCSRACGARMREREMSDIVRSQRSQKRSVNSTKNNRKMWVSFSEERRNDVCSKIAASTRASMALIDPVTKQRSDVARSQTMKERWAQDHDAIIGKWVDTMKKRGTARISSVEQRFVGMLRESFGDVRQQVLVNGWMIDAYVPSIDTYFQVDGVYWHGIGCDPDLLAASKKRRDAKRLRTMDVDARQVAWFDAAGMKLIRVTDIDVKRGSVSFFDEGIQGLDVRSDA